MRSIKGLLQLMLDHQLLFSEGLCLWSYKLQLSGYITFEEDERLRTYIRNNRPSKFSSVDTYLRRNDVYYWKINEIKPRVKWLKKHIAKQSKS